MTSQEFNKLDRTQKRIAIAKDVIEQLNTARFIASCGTFFEVDNKTLIDDVSKDTQMNEYVIKNNKNCAVCAKGALFGVAMLVNNHFNVEEYNEEWNFDSRIKKALKGIFTEDELDVFEAVFETRVVADENEYLVNDNFGRYESDIEMYDSWEEWFEENEENLTKTARKAVKWGYSIDSPEERLRAIMENLIQNNGELVIPEVELN